MGSAFARELTGQTNLTPIDVVLPRHAGEASSCAVCSTAVSVAGRGDRVGRQVGARGARLARVAEALVQLHVAVSGGDVAQPHVLRDGGQPAHRAGAVGEAAPAHASVLAVRDRRVVVRVPAGGAVVARAAGALVDVGDVALRVGPLLPAVLGVDARRRGAEKNQRRQQASFAAAHPRWRVAASSGGAALCLASHWCVVWWFSPVNELESASSRLWVRAVPDVLVGAVVDVLFFASGATWHSARVPVRAWVPPSCDAALRSVPCAGSASSHPACWGGAFTFERSATLPWKAFHADWKALGALRQLASIS